MSSIPKINLCIRSFLKCMTDLKNFVQILNVLVVLPMRSLFKSVRNIIVEIQIILLSLCVEY